MDRALNRIYSIANHPVSSLDGKYRLKYVRGLGACLFSLSDDSGITKLCYSIWAQSILRELPYTDEFWCEDFQAIKKAIALQAKGLRLFTMRYYLFFDTYYLLQAFCLNGFDATISERIKSFMDSKICTQFSKNALRIIHGYFSDNITNNRISSQLIKHRVSNECFLAKMEKTILVVANVSAGKSTLINALVGYRRNKSLTTACTRRLHYIHNKVYDDGLVVKQENGSYLYSSFVEDTSINNVIESAFHFKTSLGSLPCCFIDSPGVNNADNCSHRTITENAIKSNDYDAIIYVSNCRYFGTDDEYELLNFLKKNTEKPVLFVLNQLDVFKQKEDSISKMLNDFNQDLNKLGFKNPVIAPVSAKAALFLELPDELLDDEDKEDKEKYIRQFQKEYYNLPSYIGGTRNADVIENTGICNLESIIINTVFTDLV